MYILRGYATAVGMCERTETAGQVARDPAV